MSALALDAVISLLILQLGDSRYSAREKAHRALAVLAPLSATQLERATSHPDMEVRRRAWQIAKPYIQTKVERQAFGLRERWPWLYLESTYEVWYWIECATKRWVIHRGGPEWAEYRAAAKLYARHLMLSGSSAVNVEEVMQKMDLEEQRWISLYRR